MNQTQVSEPAARVEKPKAVFNERNQAGKLASRKVVFGPWKRYAVAAVHTRQDRVQWFVWDANVKDTITGQPEVIRQEFSFEAAIDGLEAAC